MFLYLASSLVLQAIYGPSYGFLQGEDRWIPNGQGGWIKHGDPTNPEPSVPSVQVPLMVHYIPIFLPAFLLILFMFTPLRHHLEKPRADSDKISPDESGQVST
ncbi:MAG: hypothetical protein ACE5K8_00025 [Candidatus Zixiibacteriota bacterium]